MLILACYTAPSRAADDAEPESTARLPHGEGAVLSVDSPIGLIEYTPARGLRLGDTGLNLGGFTTFEIEKQPGEDGEFSLDSINFFILFEPHPRLRAFAEIEVGSLLDVDMETGESESDPVANFQRLFGDIMLDEAFNVRLGKFQTPVGRWNLVPAEPFTWTATDPIILEAFDEQQTGGMAFGTFYPGHSPLGYWIYGQFTDAFDTEPDEVPADRSVGGKLEYGSATGVWSVGASFLASQDRDQWGYLGGLDAGWRWDRFELSSEFVYTGGELDNPIRWDLYLQGVIEVLPRFYIVGRYEHTNFTGEPNPVDMGDLGVTWLPVSFLNLKATYRWTDHPVEDVFEGFKASFSVIF